MSLNQLLNTTKGKAGKIYNKNDKTIKKPSFNFLQIKSNANNSTKLATNLSNQLNSGSLQNHQMPKNLSIFNSQPAHQPQFKVEQLKFELKNAPYCLAPTNLSMKNDNNLVNLVNQDKFNNELMDINRKLSKIGEELKRIVNGRQNEIGQHLKLELLNQLDSMQKCLTQDEESNLNNELMGIFDQYKNINYLLNNGEQGLNLAKNLFSNAPIDDKLISSLASLNSPVSINSPTTSLNNQTEDDNQLSSTTALSTNQFSLDDQQMNNDKLDRTQMTTSDNYIIDNRKNINQNRIKSSILGAAKHLSKKQKVDLNNTAINLSIHSTNEQQQTKSKRCVCDTCGQSFTQRNSLNRHIRGHTGERPFPCGECKKSFSDKQRLLIHERIHTGDRPFSCGVCHRSFTQKSTVKRHLIVHGVGSTKQPGAANLDFNSAADLKKRIKPRRPRRSKMTLKAGSNQTVDYSKSSQLKDEPKIED